MDRKLTLGIVTLKILMMMKTGKDQLGSEALGREICYHPTLELLISSWPVYSLNTMEMANLRFIGGV